MRGWQLRIPTLLRQGQTTAETGNVVTGIGTTSGVADVSGADGGLTVVGVAAGDVPGGTNASTVGVAITGAFGTLTLNADGSYSYTHTGVVGGGTDVFAYYDQGWRRFACARDVDYRRQ